MHKKYHEKFKILDILAVTTQAHEGIETCQFLCLKHFELVKDIQCLSPAKNGEYNRTREKWQLSDKLFEIATRAVSDDRTKRQQSIRQFTAEWEAAQ